MTDGLLTDNDIEEALSRVYVQAVAARAGYSTGGYSFDRDGVDLLIHASGMMRPAIALQLKATINLGKSSEGFFITGSGPRITIFCASRRRRRACWWCSICREIRRSG